jgi:hypothetical protein
MKGDIAFAGFVLTAAEWQELEPDARAQLIAVATKRIDPWVGAPAAPMGLGDEMRLADGSGPFETEEFLELEPESDVDDGWDDPPAFAAGSGVVPTPNWSAAGDIDFGPVLDPLLESRLLTKLR